MVFDFVQAHRVVISTGQPNYVTARVSVPLRLHILSWRLFLHDYHDNIICDFLEFSWPIGYVRDTLPSFTFHTHRGALDYPDSVSQYLTSELKLGHFAGPFRSVSFTNGFVISPLNTVKKRDSSERCVIVDLSWPCGSSVNDGILRDSFLGVPINLHYSTIDRIVEAILATDQGCLLYKRDLKKAYRQFPVDSHDYHLLGYLWQNNFYFDAILTMGLRSAAMVCQRVTSAISWICSQRGQPVFNYLDDFIGVALPSTTAIAFGDLGDLLFSLGLIESTDKASPPSTRIVCLGVELDTNALTLSVSCERLDELECLLADWLTKKTTTKSALQSLVGKLVFVSKCVRQSRVFLSRILSVLRTIKFNHHHVNLNAEFRKDIRWWCRFLWSYNGVSMTNTASWSLPGEVFTTDACLTGCGGLCDDEYFHSVFPDFILSQHLDINCLELLTIIIALKLWWRRWKGLRLTVRCDNEVAVTVLNTGWCRNQFLNSCLHEICYLSASFEFEVHAIHLPGGENFTADTISHWHDNTSARDHFLTLASNSHLTEVEVPAAMFEMDSPYKFHVYFFPGLSELTLLKWDLRAMRRSAYCSGTYSNLRTQFRAFLLFCLYFKFTPIPVQLETICLYAQFLSRTLTPQSIRNYLSGVKLLHLFVGANYPFTKGFILSLMLRGVARQALHTPWRASRYSFDFT